MTTQQLRDAWLIGERQREWQTRKWRAKVYKIMKGQVIAFAEAFRQRPVWADDNINRFFPVQPLGEVLVALFRDVVIRNAYITYKGVIRSTKRLSPRQASLGFDQDFADLLNKILDDDFLSFLETVNNNTKKIILDIIKQGIQNGDGVNVIADRIMREGINISRVKFLVRTEINFAANAGHMIGARKTGLLLQKIWSSAPFSKRTRGHKLSDKGDHVHMNMQTHFMEEFFVDPRNDGKMDAPGDRTHGAPLSTTINCRCVVVFEAVKDEDGLPIRITARENR